MAEYLSKGITAPLIRRSQHNRAKALAATLFPTNYGYTSLDCHRLKLPVSSSKQFQQFQVFYSDLLLNYY